MALDIPLDYAQVLMSFKHSTLVREWAITYGIETASYAGDIADLPNSLATQWSESLGSRQDNNITLTDVIVRLNVGDPDPLILSGITPTVGGLGFNGAPSNTAVLITKRTLKGGRRHKGRVFVPGLLANSDVGETGLIGGAQLAAIDVDTQDWFDRLTTNGTPMYVLHNDPPVGVTPTLVTALVTEGLAATQRRRMRP